MNNNKPFWSFPIDSSLGASTIFLTSTGAASLPEEDGAIGDSGVNDGFQKIDVLKRLWGWSFSGDLVEESGYIW